MVQPGSSTLVYLLPQEGSQLYLAYEVDVRGEEGELPVHDLVYIDAQSGSVLERHPLIHTALNRVIYDAKHTSSIPGTKMRSEGAAATSDAGSVRSAVLAA